MIRHHVPPKALCVLYFLVALTEHLVWCDKSLISPKHTSFTVYVGKPYQQELKTLLPTSLRLEDVAFHADIPCTHDELIHVSSLQIGQLVFAKDIIYAIEMLFEKHAFDSIELHFYTHDDLLSLHLDLTAYWRFDTLKIHGLWTGKDAYRHMYVMEVGDRFDKTKHEHSLEKITKAFAGEGFLGATITDTLDYNQETKSVTVSLSVHKGLQYNIYQSFMHVEADTTDISDDDILLVKNSLEKKYVKPLVSAPCNQDEINKCAKKIKEYLTQQGFLHASIHIKKEVDHEHQQVLIHWHIILHQRRRFVFFGNSFFSSKQLLHHLFKFGRSAWLLPASILSEELEKLYYSKGFWHVHIESREEQERYFFLFTEGERASIKNIQVENSHFIEGKTVQDKFFYQLLKDRYFDQSTFDQAFQDLIAWYIKHGFLDVRVARYEFIPTQVPGMYQLKIILDEGDRYTIERVSIEGCAQVEGDTLLEKLLKDPEKKIFTLENIQLQKKILQSHLRSQGFQKPRIRYEIQKESDQSVHITWYVNPGLQDVRFGKTIVRISSAFPFTIIQRELAYKENDLWSQEKIRQSFLQLKDLEVFDAISITTVPDKETPDIKNVLVTLHEDDPYEVRARAGIGFQHVKKYHTFGGLTYKFGGTFIAKNPSNVADQFRADLDFARSHREVVFKYIRPLPAPIPFKLLMEGYSIKYDEPGFIGNKKNLYKFDQNGFFFGLYRRLSYLDFTLNVGFEVMETSFTDDLPETKCFAEQLACAIDFDQNLVGHSVPYFFLEPTFFVDILDNKLSPTQGFYTLMTLKGMFPFNQRGRNSFFVKILCEQALFIPIGPMVAAMRFRFGHIFHRQFCAIMPPERFYLGGSRSLRGYDTDIAPPVGVFYDQEGKKHEVPRGGKSMFNANIELRFPIYKLIGGALFQDMGVLSGDNFNDFKFEKLLAASGFGFRYYTPVGPLRFDIGWKWRVTEPLCGRYAWFLTFGHAF